MFKEVTLPVIDELRVVTNIPREIVCFMHFSYQLKLLLLIKKQIDLANLLVSVSFAYL